MVLSSPVQRSLCWSWWVSGKRKDARLLGEKMPAGLEWSSSHSTPGAGSHTRLAVLSPGVQGPASLASCPDIPGPSLQPPALCFRKFCP